MMVSRRQSTLFKIRAKFERQKSTGTFHAILAFLEHCTRTVPFTFNLSVIGHAGARSDHSYVSELQTMQGVIDNFVHIEHSTSIQQLSTIHY